MIVEALPFQTHLTVSRTHSGRVTEGWGILGSRDSRIREHGDSTAIRDDVVRRIRAEVEAGTYLNRERINATADRLHRAFAPAGRPRGPSL